MKKLLTLTLLLAAVSASASASADPYSVINNDSGLRTPDRDAVRGVDTEPKDRSRQHDDSAWGTVRAVGPFGLSDDDVRNRQRENTGGERCNYNCRP